MKLRNTLRVSVLAITLVVFAWLVITILPGTFARGGVSDPFAYFIFRPG